MSQLLQLFILLPLLAFGCSLAVSRNNEKLLSGVAITTTVIQLAGTVFFILYWLFNSAPILNIKHVTLFAAGNIEIFIDFYFDKATAVFALIGAVLTMLVALFSRFYLHREEGFKRYFSTLLLFFLGYNLVIYSGNFETLFIGWEVLGICSFLLIAFYRDRYLPVKNGLKVISFFRLSDVCLILAMWMSHQLWHQNITFFQLNNAALVQEHFAEYSWYGYFIALMLVLVASIKSAQLPFSSWLPRAMEGPTTSSAIFYGSLSVHIGVFLLLRTYPYWEQLTGIKVLIVTIGLSTSIIASGIARVQSTVKTQIAYSSITQIGFMFIEVAAGWHTLALIHFAANAFLRTYQLLVSPSVMSYSIHEMVFSYKERKPNSAPSLMNKISNSFYMLSVKEWNLDRLLHLGLWNPFKWVGNRFSFLSGKTSAVLLGLLLAVGFYIDLQPQSVPASIYKYLPIVFSVVGLLMVLRSFAERKGVRTAWMLIIGGQLFITLSIALFHENFGHNYMLIYLSGSAISCVIGLVCLNKIKKIETNVDLNGYHGHHYEHPILAFVFLISCLGVVGFPFTPTFIGIDLLFSHIHKQEVVLIIFTALSFVFIELAVLRIYSRIFLGPHKKAYHPIAYRSS